MKEKRGSVGGKRERREEEWQKQKDDSEGVWKGREQDEKRDREDGEKGKVGTKGGGRVNDKRKMKYRSKENEEGGWREGTMPH